MMISEDGLIERLIKFFKKLSTEDQAPCLQCGYSIASNGSIVPFCEECGVPNSFLDRKKFEEEFGMTPEQYAANCREPNHNGLFPTPEIRAAWDAPFCPWCGAELLEPYST